MFSVWVRPLECSVVNVFGDMCLGTRVGTSVCSCGFQLSTQRLTSQLVKNQLMLIEKDGKTSAKCLERLVA